MTNIPHPKWFRFSLRTLFAVVAVFGAALGWLVWQMQFVRERNKILAELALVQPIGNRLIRLEYQEGISRADQVHVRVSRMRRWLGDEAYLLLAFPSDREDLIHRAEWAFPEAEIRVYRVSNQNGIRNREYQAMAIRDSLLAPAENRVPNRGNIFIFKTGLIEK